PAPGRIGHGGDDQQNHAAKLDSPEDHPVGYRCRRLASAGMRRFVEEDLKGAEFRECELDGARFVGVVMQNVEIDGLINQLVINGVEVTRYVDSELDRSHPVRLLIRSDEPADL